MTREEAKEIIEELYISGTGYCTKGEFPELCEIIIKALEQESKTGHWIKYDCKYFATGRLTPITRSIRECSVCHTKISDFCGKMYYCPYCGAKMVEPPESEVSE